MGRRRKIQDMDIPKVGIRLLTQADELTEDEKQKQEEGWEIIEPNGIKIVFIISNLVPVEYTDGAYYNFPESKKIRDGVYFFRARLVYYGECGGRMVFREALSRRH